jgi:hypothetical protein
MSRSQVQLLRLLCLICPLLLPAGLFAQPQRQLPPPDESAYSSKFFEQLHKIFGIFREEDLRRVFQMAKPIRCPDLVASTGQWRTVAFFNEDRTLGEWCRNSIEETKTDLSVYIFNGSCKGDRGSIKVTTQFPVESSMDAYHDGLIPLSQVDVNINAPVSVVFDSRNQTYDFELPYLYLTGRRNSGSIYSLMAPTREDRYAREVANRWECKSVRSNDVTYEFLICRTAIVDRRAVLRDQELGFGASAYFILSDGMEAKTSVSMSFGDAGPPPTDNTPGTAPSITAPVRSPSADGETEKPAGGWLIPDAQSRIVDVRKNEFRIRFNPQTWMGKIGAPQILSDQKMSGTRSVRLREGADYCSWRPGHADLAERLLVSKDDADVLYYLDAVDKTVEYPAASIVFDMKDHSGTELGTLKCNFRHTRSASKIVFADWISVVGNNLTIEIRQ